MEERPLWSRFGRLPTYTGRLMKEAHAVIYAAIASVTWFILSLVGPSILPRYGLAFPSLGLPVAICGSVIIALAILGLAGFLVWEEEERQHAELRGAHTALQELLRPRMRIEFDPNNPKFIAPTITAQGLAMLFVRVNVRALSPVVRDCRAYLIRISHWDGQQYISLFDEHLPMPWSRANPNGFEPRELNHDVDALLDVAWLADPADPYNSFGPFGFLNHNTVLPFSLGPILAGAIEHPEQNLKLDILVTATESESATLSINVHRGGPRWNQPQIGWMEGNAIHREPNF